jgi:hypothetical protein
VLILENLHGAEVSIEALQYRPPARPAHADRRQLQQTNGRRHPLMRMLDSFADDPRHHVARPAPPCSTARWSNRSSEPEVADALCNACARPEETVLHEGAAALSSTRRDRARRHRRKGFSKAEIANNL